MTIYVQAEKQRVVEEVARYYAGVAAHKTGNEQRLRRWHACPAKLGACPAFLYLRAGTEEDLMTKKEACAPRDGTLSGLYSR